MTERAPNKHILVGSVVAAARAAAGIWIAVQAARDSRATPQTTTQGGHDVLGKVPPFELIDSEGRPFTPEDIKGRMWVANVMFTQCSGTCPVMSQRMAELQAALAHITDMVQVSISCDPKNDTPDRLVAYASNYGAAPMRWKFVTGDRKKTEALVVDGLKLAMRDASDEELAGGMERVIHSRRFVLIDREGRIRGYYDGTDEADVQRLIRDATKIYDQYALGRSKERE